MVWTFDRAAHADDRTGQEVPVLFDAAAVALLISALPDPVLVLDGAGLVIAANSRAQELLPTFAAGQHVAQSIRAPAVLEAVTQVLANGGSISAEYQVRLPVLQHFEVLVTAMKAATREAPSAVVVLKDLTREQLVERTRSDFVANASHELRTPLASLSGFIETLQGAAKDDPVARSRFLELMLSQANRMKRLIDDLLSLSRIEMNVHLRPAEEVDLVLIIAHVRDLLNQMAAKEGVEIVLNLPPHLKVRGERDELVQVHLNLVENALKYAASGKRIEITAKTTPNDVEVCIKDFGPGIPAEHIPRLTERFYRINVQDSRSRGGTGLGLAIVKHVLNRHNGKLIITSVQGEGSQFVIRLPLIHA